MAITVSGTSITFNDSTTQTTAAGAGKMEEITSVANSAATSFSLSVPTPSLYNKFILVWNGSQYSGPAGSSLTLTESTTGALYTALTGGSVLVSSTGTSTVGQGTYAASITNFLLPFSSASSFSKGEVIITRIKGTDATTASRYFVSVRGGSTGAAFIGSFNATGSTSASSFFISTLTFSLGLTNGISLRLYGVRQ